MSAFCDWVERYGTIKTDVSLLFEYIIRPSTEKALSKQAECFGLVWFVFLFNVPINNFSVMLGWSHRFLGVYQYFGHYTAVVGLEPWTCHSGDLRTTTEPPRLPQAEYKLRIYNDR